MNLKSHLEQGWNSFLRFIGPALLVTFVLFVVIIFSLGILAPVTTAGYFQSLLQAQRDGRTPEVKDLFAHMSLFLPLFVFGLASFCIIMVGFMLLFLPGVGAAVFITFACLYLLPLMTDKKMGLIDGIKQSWQLAIADPIGDHVIITIVYIAILSIGGSIPFAILLAQPLATFILLSFFDERTKLLLTSNDEQNQQPADS